MYDKLKVAELKALCVERGLDLGRKRLKAELRAALEEDDEANSSTPIFFDKESSKHGASGASSENGVAQNDNANVESSVNEFLESESVNKTSNLGDAVPSASSTVAVSAADSEPVVDASKMFGDNDDEEAAYREVCEKEGLGDKSNNNDNNNTSSDNNKVR